MISNLPTAASLNLGDFIAVSESGVGNVRTSPGAEHKATLSTLLTSLSAVTTAAQTAYAQPIAQAISADTGATYTLVAADAGTLVTLSHGSAIQVDVPADADAVIAIGASVDLYQLGAGQVTVVAGAGATLRVGGLTAKARAQYSGLTVQKVSANTWRVFGDVAAS